MTRFYLLSTIVAGCLFLLPNCSSSNPAIQSNSMNKEKWNSTNPIRKSLERPSCWIQTNSCPDDDPGFKYFVVVSKDVSVEKRKQKAEIYALNRISLSMVTKIESEIRSLEICKGADEEEKCYQESGREIIMKTNSLIQKDKILEDGSYFEKKTGEFHYRIKIAKQGFEEMLKFARELYDEY